MKLAVARDSTFSCSSLRTLKVAFWCGSPTESSVGSMFWSDEVGKMPASLSLSTSERSKFRFALIGPHPLTKLLFDRYVLDSSLSPLMDLGRPYWLLSEAFITPRSSIGGAASGIVFWVCKRLWWFCRGWLFTAWILSTSGGLHFAKKGVLSAGSMFSFDMMSSCLCCFGVVMKFELQLALILLWLYTIF